MHDSVLALRFPKTSVVKPLAFGFLHPSPLITKEACQVMFDQINDGWLTQQECRAHLGVGVFKDKQYFRRKGMKIFFQSYAMVFLRTNNICKVWYQLTDL